MKKTIIFAILLLVSVSAIAQDERYEVTNKKGQNILPVAGDFAISIDASPMLYYFGNMFNGNTNNNAPDFEGHRYQVYGKYFTQDRRAIRVGLSVDARTNLYKSTVSDDSQPITAPQVPDKTFMDVRNHKSTNVQLMLGYEFRRGYKRLQAFYGGEFVFGVTGNKNKYKYANAMTSMNPSPTTTNFGSNVLGFGERVTQTKGGTDYNFGLGVFVGAEYFFAPKMSVGGEFGFRAGYGFKTQNVNTYEFYDTNLDAIQTVKERDRNSSDIAGNGGLWNTPYGSLNVTFHF